MNPSDSSPQGKISKKAESLEMLEKEKLKAEIGRLNAQEALIRDKISAKWYEDSSLASQLIRGLFQAVATVLIGIPILWFYVENVVKPGVEVRVLESKKDNLQEEIELNQTIIDLNQTIQELRHNLDAAVTSDTQTKEQLEQANQELGEARTTLSSVRVELDGLRTTATPENVNATLDSATNQINSAEQTIDSL